MSDEIALLTFTGWGGVGKTALALQVASSLLERFPDGVFFINLAPLTKSELIPIEIAHTLKIKHPAGKDVVSDLHELLPRQRMLLVLDNFEHLMQATSFVNDLLLACPSLKLLVTSREPLRLRTEQSFLVRPLETEQAIELFTRRAQSVNSDYDLSVNSRNTVAELCRRLDGLPLTIELAALRTRLFTPDALLARLKPDLQPASRILNLLSVGSRDVPERQQSLRKTIEWSYSLLDATEQKTLRAASVFPAGFTIQILSAIMGSDDATVLQNVSSLVDKNLVKPATENLDEERFALLEAIREYAWDEILRLGEVEALRASYIATYLSLLEKAGKELQTEKQDQWLDAFDDEFLNINLALEMCLTSTQGSERWKIGFRILDNFHRYFMLHGQFHYAAEHIAQARASIEDYEKKGNALDKETLRLKAGIYSLTGSLAWGLGNYREGGDWHGKAYSIHEALADEAGMAEALNNWAVNLGMLGENQTALEKHERGLALYRKIGDRWGEAKQLNNLGNLLHVMGREDVAVATFEQALAIARELKDAFFTSSLLCNIAHLRVHAGDYAAAISLLNDGAESTNKAETPYLRAWSLVILTLAYLKQDQVEVAIHTLQEGIELLPNLTDMSLKVEYLKTSVYALAYSGYPMDAVQLFSTVTKICEELGLSEYPPDEAELREFIQTLRSKMSAEAISTAEQKGRDFTFDSAFAFIVEKLNPPAPPPPSPELEQVLTTREREVLVLLSKGMTNEEISRELVVVIKTVEKHVANILMKLGMKNRTEAAAWAVERGIK
ncbi:MAG: tetratricopeptide repeat protein [Chloroflexi bacterium]|nr:tetratricopeptide repeat protein [Chloroflexota bacterium]